MFAGRMFNLLEVINYYFYYFQENKARDLSLRLQLTQRELKPLKVQLVVRTVALWNS